MKELSVYAALALCACNGGSRIDDSVAASNTQIPLRYRYNACCGASVPTSENYDTPSQAYSTALTRLNQSCASSSKPFHECLGDVRIEITPSVRFDDSSTLDTIAQFGYAATYERYIEGALAVRSMFQSRDDARASDFYQSLNTIEAGDIYALSSWGREEVQERDEMIEQARGFKEKVIEQGEALYGEEHANLVRTQQAIAAARELLARYQRAVAERQAEYETVAADYKLFHEAESTAADALRELVTRASDAELPAFPGLQQDLATILFDENRTPQDLILRALRLEGFFESQQQWFDDLIAPHRDFLAEAGIAEPDLTSRPLEILRAMRRYLADRQQRMNAAARQLLAGMKRRRSALLLLERDAQTRATIANATRAQSAADFLAAATAQIEATWAAQPSAAGIELVSGRYEAVLALLQAASLCDDEDAGEWMLDGCGAYAVNASKANLYLQSSLPRKLRRDATKLRGAGVADAEVAALEAAVDAGDLAAAVGIHDSLTHQLEENP